jgi:hypothetical protein
VAFDGGDREQRPRPIVTLKRAPRVRALVAGNVAPDGVAFSAEREAR